MKSHALLVGVGKYIDASIPPIPCCWRDVDDLYGVLLDRHLMAYEPIDVVRLRDGLEDDFSPIENTIRFELRRLADRAKASDTLLFYFTGHGFESSGKAFLVARDTYRNALEDAGRLGLDEVRDILRASKASQKIVVVDACHCGEAIAKAAPVPMGDVLNNALSNLARGMAVLSSCERGQFSWTAGHNSLFTKFILKGLKGSARRRDGRVTLFSLSEYIGEHVEEAAQIMSPPRHQNPTLFNETHARGFVLVGDKVARPRRVRPKPQRGVVFPMVARSGSRGNKDRPLVPIRVSRAGTELEALALIDTGAAVNVAPAEYMRLLGAPIERMAHLRSPFGRHEGVPVFRAVVSLAGVSLETSFMAVPSVQTPLLGAEFLSSFAVTFDYRACTVTFHP